MKTNSAVRLSSFTVGLTLLGGQFCADARLRETRGALTGDEGRYGAPTGESTPAIKDSLEIVDVFKKDGIGVTAEYDQDGRVWRITYSKKDLGIKLIENLLAKNAGERTWSEAQTYNGTKYWVTKDKMVHAVYYGNPVYKLVVMTKLALNSERTAQTVAGRKTKRVSEDEEGVEEPQTADPLEGF